MAIYLTKQSDSRDKEKRGKKRKNDPELIKGILMYKNEMNGQYLPGSGNARYFSGRR